MMMIFWVVIVILAFIGLPQPAKILAFIVNVFVPDGLPFIDEIIMLVVIATGE